MTVEELKFIEDNIENFAAINDGYCKHMDHNILGAYESIYRSNLDKHFVLTKWCGHCVFDMMLRLRNYYEENKPKK
jgi:hypothetical protein